jgi:hypothetical protein
MSLLLCFIEEHLAEYPIPEDIRHLIDSHATPSGSKTFNPWMLRENYKQRLHALLWIEEAQRKVNIRQVSHARSSSVYLYHECSSFLCVQYDMYDVTFEQVPLLETRGGMAAPPEPCLKYVCPQGYNACLLACLFVCFTDNLTSIHFRLRVPGLAEKRPSILYGDSLYVSMHCSKQPCT